VEEEDVCHNLRSKCFWGGIEEGSNHSCRYELTEVWSQGRPYSEQTGKEGRREESETNAEFICEWNPEETTHSVCYEGSVDSVGELFKGDIVISGEIKEAWALQRYSDPLEIYTTMMRLVVPRKAQYARAAKMRYFWSLGKLNGSCGSSDGWGSSRIPPLVYLRFSFASVLTFSEKLA